ncbi:LytS/YehU family sensor histidine kinase [Bacillus niacini]|uniref:LytS/YehU family sensor histidine kinase n=2 Tax=Neobacillus TaxID=2675232 RepID=A0A852TEN0_9BACI|nr:LytS/YehU family sensor histidine kinase [Neobacillus niacini]
MLFSFQINPTTIADLRHLAIVIAAAFGGWVPAIIASGLIAIGRVVLFGLTDTAIVAAISAFLTGLVCGGFSKFNIPPTLKAFYMNLIGLFFISIVFALYRRYTDAFTCFNPALYYFFNRRIFRLSLIHLHCQFKCSS